MDYWVLPILAVVIVLIYFFIKYQKLVASVKHIPGPPLVPLIGNCLMLVGKKPNEIVIFAQELVKEYGYLFRLILGPQVLILVGEPEDVEAILADGKTIDKSEEYEYMKPWIGEGLITSTGQKWFQRRKVITPAFHFSILQSFVQIFDSNGDIFVQKLGDYESLDIFPLIKLCTLDNICEAAMGVKINAQCNADSSYVRAIDDITSIITQRQIQIALRNNFIFKLSGLQAKQKKLLDVVHGFTDKVIVERRHELMKKLKDEKLENSDSESKQKSAFIDILLQSQINGQPLSNMDIREEVDTFMFAGHDTTTSAIAFSLYNLASYPEAQQKAFEEVRNVVGGKSLTLKDLNDLHYLELVVKETLRMYPSVPIIGRRLNKDTVINGKVFPKNASVGVSPALMGMNSKVWVNPESFMPERFELDNLTHINPFAYTPFSAGPRNCIGQKFAMLEMKATIAKVLTRFELSVEPDFELVLISELVMKSLHGIKLRLKARVG